MLFVCTQPGSKLPGGQRWTPTMCPKFFLKEIPVLSRSYISPWGWCLHPEVVSQFWKMFGEAQVNLLMNARLTHRVLLLALEVPFLLGAPLSKKRLAHWVMDVFTLGYKLAGHLGRTRTCHSMRTASKSWVLLRDLRSSTFSRCYRDNVELLSLLKASWTFKIYPGHTHNPWLLPR